jgi:hypothetical protein
MTVTQAQHLATGLLFAAFAALAAAFAVVFFPSLPGDAGTGGVIAFYIAAHLARHHGRKRDVEEGLGWLILAGFLAAVLIWKAAPVVPVLVFAVLAAVPARHYLDPAKHRVVRTTRGVKDPAARSAGGRAGKSGEQVRPRRTRTAPATPLAQAAAATPLPAPRAKAAISAAPKLRLVTTEHGAYVEIKRVHQHGGVEIARTAVLPPDTDPDELEPVVVPDRLRHRDDRPSPLHRSMCNDCLDRNCGLCKDRGCECNRSPQHPRRNPAPCPPPASAGADVPPF